MREVREGVWYLRHVVDEQGPLVVVMSDPDPCPFHSHSTMTELSRDELSSDSGHVMKSASDEFIGPLMLGNLRANGWFSSFSLMF